MFKLEQYKNKAIGIIGAGVTGRSVIEAFDKAGADKIYVWEDNPGIETNSIKTSFSELIFTKDLAAWRECVLIVPSPGVVINGENAPAVIRQAREQAAQIISDIDLLYNTLSDKKYIGITGTNGKSTVTSLIAHILGTAGLDYQAGGNIGRPALALDAEKPGYVLELSSFQLDLTEALRLDIALILSITPDHLDRYNSFEGYIEAKAKIAKLLKPGGVLVINADNPGCRKLYNNLPREVIEKINITRVHCSSSNSDGVSLFPATGVNNHKYLKLEDRTGATGEDHNLFFEDFNLKSNPENLASSYAVTTRLSVNFDNFYNALTSFTGLSHRMEFVGRYKNIKFINDSKATNLAAVTQALSSYKNIYWLAGGVLKDKEFETLQKYLTNTLGAYFFGRHGQVLKSYFENYITCNAFQDLSEAFNFAVFEAKNSYSEETNNSEEICILLSPAGASFDQFKNFEHRGDYFKTLCRQFISDSQEGKL
jgi:UDP-N-acetylmuramoylalanine--D-glutamate ligase